MDYYILVFVSIFALIFLYIIAKISSKGSKKLPPGPSPWPIIGNFHLLGAKPHVSLANLAKAYGPIMSLKIGQMTTVVISSSTIAKQVLKNQDQAFSSRFIPNVVQAHNYSKFSVVWFPVCPQWRTLKRILNTKMVSPHSLDANQHLRSQKVKELIDYCEKCSQQGEALDVSQVAFKTILNLLSNTLFSKDLANPFSDSKVDELKDVIWRIMNEVGKINLVDSFPILDEKIDFQGIRCRATIHIGKLFELFEGWINERLEDKRRGCCEKSDVLEVLLNAENTEEINQNHIKSMLLDLIIGGIDTTTNTLEWAMSETLRQQEIMKKAQSELAEVVGKGKSIEEDDVSRLPYLQFIINETLRMHPPAPFLIPRRVDHDVKLFDYIIPKGSLVLVNVWVIGRDSTFWEEPLIFKPERFQSLELDVRGKDFELIPFGAGRRICPGLPLALRMVQVMLGSMLNSFNWKLEADIDPKDLDMDEKFGFIIPKAHPLRVIRSPL